MGCCCSKASYDIAGNRIRSGQGELDQDLPGSMRIRGRHVIKVFAQVFHLVHVFGGEDDDNVVQTNIDDEDQFDWIWEAICEVPVHVDLVCIKEGELYEYAVYAVEKEVCPFNATITVPGTEIRKTGLYFIQWMDPYMGTVYGLNFFTEQEALRFLSSCFPPTITPDSAAIRRASATPSYPCPSPPTPVFDLPFMSKISSSNDHRGYIEGADTPTEGEQESSMPTDAEEFFDVVIGPIKPLRSSTMKKSPKVTDKMEAKDEETSEGELSLKSDGCDSATPPPAPLPTSESMDLIEDRPLSVDSLPSPPSEFNIKENANEEDEQSGEEDTREVDLYQGVSPLEYDRTLQDIPEEDFESDNMSLSSISSRRGRLVKMRTNDNGPAAAGPKDDPLDSSLSETHSVTSLTAQDFDDLFQDLDLNQITKSPQKQVSRQPSFIGDPPTLPCTPPPGPMLSPLEGDFDTDHFKNALKRLSFTSLEAALFPDLSQASKQPLPSRSTTSSPQATGNAITHEERSQQDEAATTPSPSGLPPSVDDLEDSGGLHRQASFLRHQFNPPEEFSNDSGVATETQDHEDDSSSPYRQSQLLEALRIADMNKSSKDSPSTSPSASVKKVRNGDTNWIMASKPLFGEEALSMTIRKSGWLEVKVLLVRKNKKVAMKSRRKWQKYWALLKGVNLLLYKWNSETMITDHTPYDSKLDITGCLAYPVTNHMKRHYLFSLTLATGNTYYMEAICRSAADEWIQELHIASVLAMTNKTTRDEALEEMNEQLSKTEKDIQTERRMKNLAELQLTTSTDNRKSTINKQIGSFSEDIDRLMVDLYRIKCYQASLKGTELPSSESVLGTISRPTKNIVSKVGIFSVASLQSVMCTRYSKPVEVPDSLDLLVVDSHKENSAPPKQKERRGFRLFSSNSNSSGFGPRRRLKLSSPVISSPVSSDHVSDPHLLTFRQILEPDPLMTGFGSMLTVQLYNGKTCEVPFKIDLNVGDVILACCKKYELDPSDHFLLVENENENTIPNEDIFINNLSFEYLSVRQKFMQTIYFDDSVNVEDRGFTLKPDLRNLGAVTHAVIGKVTEGSLAHDKGLREGDEVVLLNDMSISHLSWNAITEILKDPSSLGITVRMCRVDVSQSVVGRTTHVHLRDLVCPSPPTRDRRLSPEKIDNLIVPKPSSLTKSYSYERQQSMDNDSDTSEHGEDCDRVTTESERVKQLIKNYSEVSKLVGIWKAYEEASFTQSPDTLDDTVSITTLTQSQKIRKCVQEIIETEIEHVKMLEVLIDRYLAPMQHDKFLPREKMNSITEHITRVVVQQKQFKGRIEVIPEIFTDQDTDMQPMLQELCSSVEVHLDTFRQYSQFYAAQYELDKLFDECENKQRLEQFLTARNPTQDPNFALNNLLSKPILRLLRYPLFFKGILDLLDNTTMTEIAETVDRTISNLMKVTGYINEVQRVSESYLSLFDQLLEESGLAEFGVSVRVNHLLTHATAMWLNAKGPGIGKSWKKGLGPEAHCFVFESVLIILCIEKKNLKRNTTKASLREESVSMSDIVHSVLLPLAQCKANDLPDSDGVIWMWQVIHKSRSANSKPTTYTFRSNNVNEKVSILQNLTLAIADQLALYGSKGMSGSKSPSMSTISSTGTGTTYQDSPMKNRLISRLTNKSDSVDSEYELTLL